MAGPVIASLGPFAFEAHGFGLTDVSRSLKTPWKSISVPGGLNQLQWTGGDSDTVTITGVLFPHIFGGLSALAGLRVAAEAGQPLHLVQRMGLSIGNIIALFVIEGIDDQQSFIGSNGVPMKDTYTLKLRRFPGTSFSFQSVLVGLF